MYTYQTRVNIFYWRIKTDNLVATRLCEYRERYLRCDVDESNLIVFELSWNAPTNQSRVDFADILRENEALCHQQSANETVIMRI